MRRVRALVLSGVLACAFGLPGLHAQSPVEPPPGAGPGQQDDGPQGQPPPDHGRGRGFGHGPDGGPDHGQGGPTTSTMRGGLQLGPPGRWWDDPQFAGTLHLRPEQQTRMDTIFAQNKETLLARYDSLKQEERQLASLTRGTAIDERALFAHIDRVTQARAELEKANAHMLLQLRNELTPDQVTTLDERRPAAR